VAADAPAEPPSDALDQALQDWRQGDCVVGPEWFAWRIDPALPLTATSHKAAVDGTELVEEEALGLVVVSQTCDIVRKCRERPYLEVSPLVRVPDARLHEIRKALRPQYAFLPALAGERLVADLDRTMTVEKALVAGWARTPGLHTDQERRAFMMALARKRARFPFPDDFNEVVIPLTKRLAGKHEKHSSEGAALRALEEIRVHAAPSWDADDVEITLWFIRAAEPDTANDSAWAGHLDKWLMLCPASGRFTSVQGRVVTLNDLTAAEYVESDPLDLDHLSGA
jgi:hypothetical protein